MLGYDLKITDTDGTAQSICNGIRDKLSYPDTRVKALPSIIGAEPEMANDAWQGFKSGVRVAQFVPKTIADGLRGTLGVRNFEIITEHVDDILLTSEARIVEAMKLIWSRLKIIVEPSAAVPVAAIMDQPEQFKGKRIAIILSGGNLDLDDLPW